MRSRSERPARVRHDAGPVARVVVRVASLVVAAGVIWSAPVAAGQAAPPSSATTLTVVVTDPSGAVVPGASVTLVPRAVAGQDTPLDGLTDRRGEARFGDVPPGLWDIGAKVVGLEHPRATTVRLAGGTRRVVLKLALERVSETVVVTAAPRRLIEGGTGFSRTLTPDEIALLPDDPEALAQALREMAGPGATIVVDGFRRGAVPHKSEIALIRFRWTDLSAETHDSSPLTIEITTRPGADGFSATLGATARPRQAAARDAFLQGPSPATTTAVTAHVNVPLWKDHTGMSVSATWSRSVEPTPLVAPFPRDDSAGRAEPLTRDRWQTSLRLTHAFGPRSFLRAGGSWRNVASRRLGVGGLNLPERAYDTDAVDHSGHVSLLTGHGAGLLNDLRFSSLVTRTSVAPVSEAPTIVVAGVFAGGGAGRSGGRRAWTWEIADDLEMTRGRHGLRAGVSVEGVHLETSERLNAAGTFVFASAEAFASARPLTFTRRLGDPLVSLGQRRAGAYIQDDVRLSRAVSLGLGVRWERETGFGRGGLAPRGRVAWTPGIDRRTRFVVGAGLYHAWIPEDLVAETRRVDGTRQYDLVITAPGYPDPYSAGDAHVLPPSRFQFASDLRMPRFLQVTAGLEHKVGSGSNVKVTFETRRSTMQLRGRNANAPFADGVRPFPGLGNVTEIDGRGAARTYAVTTLWQSALPGRMVLTSSYVLRVARNDGDGPMSLPSDSHNPAADWGPAADDRRHQLTAFLLAPLSRAISVSGSVVAGSALPYTITTGRDDNGDTVVNDRPAGVSRNSARGAPHAMLSARLLWRPFHRRAAGGAAELTGRQFTVQLSVDNLLNRTNPTGYTGVVGSPRFGLPSAALPKRRAELGISIGF